jgi:hypothetical protein
VLAQPAAAAKAMQTSAVRFIGILPLGTTAG